MQYSIKLKRGLKEDLPELLEGEPGFTTDTKEFYIGSSSGNTQIATKEYVDNAISSAIQSAMSASY